MRLGPALPQGNLEVALMPGANGAGDMADIAPGVGRAHLLGQLVLGVLADLLVPRTLGSSPVANRVA